jgi:toxin ParE1/3/4
MTGKPVRPRVVAREDVEKAVAYYAAEAGAAAALGFIDEVEQTCRAIAIHPAAGSLRYAYELNLPGLRVWQLRQYPYLVFYMDHETHVDVWRVLHAHGDVPGWTQRPEAYGS